MNKLVSLYDNGFRLAIVKMGRKWGYYVTSETPIKRKRVKISRLKFMITNPEGYDTDTADRFVVSLMNKGEVYGITKGALTLIQEH